MKIFNLFEFDAKIQVMDVGAAAIAETPIYKILLDKKLAHLTAFDGDERHIQKLKGAYGLNNLSIFNYFLFDFHVFYNRFNDNIYSLKPFEICLSNRSLCNCFSFRFFKLFLFNLSF